MAAQTLDITHAYGYTSPMLNNTSPMLNNTSTRTGANAMSNIAPTSPTTTSGANAMNNTTTWTARDMDAMDITDFGTATFDGTGVTVTCVGSRVAVGPDTSFARVEIGRRTFNLANASAGLHFKTEVTLATLAEVDALHVNIFELPNGAGSSNLLLT